MVKELNEYQAKTASTASFGERIRKEYPNLPEKVYDLLELSYLSNGLGEVGEIQNKVKKIIRDTPAQEISRETMTPIAKEIGDLLWYVARLSEKCGYNLSEIAQMNLEKLSSRKSRGVINGSGDDR